MTTTSRGSIGPATTPSESARTGRQERFNRDQNVIDSATSVMSERGYAATSVQEIADRVGVLKGSLYHYFSSKEELLFRVLSESHLDAVRIAGEVEELGLEPIDELMEFLRRFCLWFLANVDRANIFFTEARQLTGERLAENQTNGRQFANILQDFDFAAREKD